MNDPELNAIEQIVRALEGLDAEVVHRVLEWANKRYLAHPPRILERSTALPRLSERVATGTSYRLTNTDWNPSFADFFRSVAPTDRQTQVLAAGYFLQRQLHQDEFDSFALNRLLREVNLPSSNITRDLSKLRMVGLAEFTSKRGDSKQARKVYRLSPEAILRIEHRLGHT